jgi:quercetin dioxygenase-like cupin family protein
MITVSKSDFDVIETPGGNFGAGIATPSRGAREVSVIHQRQAPGGSNPLHTHDREEVMVVIAGAITVHGVGESVKLGQGDSLIIPANHAHRIENNGDESSEWLLIAPAGIRFFHENGAEGTPPWAK